MTRCPCASLATCSIVHPASPLSSNTNPNSMRYKTIQYPIILHNNNPNSPKLYSYVTAKSQGTVKRTQCTLPRICAHKEFRMNYDSIFKFKMLHDNACTFPLCPCSNVVHVVIVRQQLFHTNLCNSMLCSDTMSSCLHLVELYCTCGCVSSLFMGVGDAHFITPTTRTAHCD